MLGAVAARTSSDIHWEKVGKGVEFLPLREILITPNVSSFARFTPFPRLGVAFARRTTTRTGHTSNVLDLQNLESCPVATSDGS